MINQTYTKQMIYTKMTKHGGVCNPAAYILCEATAAYDMAQNVTDGITNPVRLCNNKADSVLTTESAFGLNGRLAYRTRS